MSTIARELPDALARIERDSGGRHRGGVAAARGAAAVTGDLTRGTQSSDGRDALLARVGGALPAPVADG